MSKIELRQLNKFYGDVHAVKDINLTINEGELLVLVGPSGCGKSTLLRLISGLDEMSGGDVIIDGALANHVPTKDRDVAMVFQNHMLYPQKTVFDNMSFSLKLQGRSKKEIKQRVDEVAAMLGLSDLLERRPRHLSGGERQRVAIGRAVVRDPHFFLFDEPLSNLDTSLRERLRSEIKKLHNELGTTMIFVTHDQSEAMALADRIAIMRNGEVEQIGAPEELYDQPATQFVAEFFGSPGMNILPVNITPSDHGMRMTLAGGTEIPVPQSRCDLYRSHIGKDMRFGLRPDHITGKKALSGSDNFDLETVVKDVERRGVESIVTFEIGGSPVKARVDPKDAVKAGQKMVFCLDLTHMHIMDGQTGRVV